MDWQNAIEQDIDVKANMNYQVFFLVQESDAYCLYSNWSIKRDSKDKKDFKV